MPSVPVRPEIQRHAADLGRFLKAWLRTTRRLVLASARMISARWRALRRVTAKALDRLRGDSAHRRRMLLRMIGIAVAVITLATVILTAMVLTTSESTADRLVAAGDILVGATLLLGVVAALVALLAYAVSTGLPDIRLSVEFPLTAYPNDPVFEAHADPDHPYLLRFFGAASWKILLKNESGYSAKNPALIIRFGTISFRPSMSPVDPLSFERNWTVIDSVIHVFDLWVDEWEGYKAVQWDGGPTYSIHGHSTRRLPDVDVGELRQIPADETAVLTFEILAEGYRKVISLPVTWLLDGKLQSPRGEGRINPEWM